MLRAGLKERKVRKIDREEEGEKWREGGKTEREREGHIDEGRED